MPVSVRNKGTVAVPPNYQAQRRRANGASSERAQRARPETEGARPRASTLWLLLRALYVSRRSLQRRVRRHGEGYLSRGVTWSFKFFAFGGSVP